MPNPRLLRRSAALLTVALLTGACGGPDDDVSITGRLDQPTTTAATDGGGDGGAGLDDAGVSFLQPADGATVAPRFTVVMQAQGVTIEPSGEVREGAGHFHVMVDAGCVEPGQTIPSDDQHLHFGGGQTEADLLLDAGQHELCLQVADGQHTALDLTHTISVTVDESRPYVTLEVPEGDEVASPVPVTMTALNFEIEPSGEVREGAGHFHVMVDAGCVEAGQTIPSDDQHLHFGDGSTEAELELEPGPHTLCLQLGDGEHTALPLTHRVTVTVA